MRLDFLIRENQIVIYLIFSLTENIILFFIIIYLSIIYDIISIFQLSISNSIIVHQFFAEFHSYRIEFLVKRYQVR